MSLPTLLDIAKLNNDDSVIGLIEEVIVVAPEMQVLPAIDIPGQSFNTLVRNALPSVGFRNANEGAAATKSGWENRLVETRIIDASVEADEAVVDAAIKGSEVFFARESKGLLMAGFKSVSSQFWYGNTATSKSIAPNKTKGFAGAIDCYSSSYEVDATGTTAKTSVWFVRKGEEHVQFVIGKNGALEVRDPFQARLTDSSGNPYDGWRMPLKAYIGAQFVNPKHSLVRIKNIGSEAGKGLTDALLSEAWGKVEDGDMSDWVIFMNKRSLMQLKNSRTATNETGKPAPIPDNWEGIPIKITGGLLNSEA